MGVLLASMVTEEVTHLPRGIHHASARKLPASANHSKALDAIPEFLKSQYEKNKQPALRQGLAGTHNFSGKQTSVDIHKFFSLFHYANYL